MDPENMEVPSPGQSVISNSLIMTRVYSFCDLATLAKCLRVSKGGFETVCQELYGAFTDLDTPIYLPEANGRNEERLATYSRAVRSCSTVLQELQTSDRGLMFSSRIQALIETKLKGRPWMTVLNLELKVPCEDWNLCIFLNERDARGRAAMYIAFDTDEDAQCYQRHSKQLLLPNDGFWVRCIRMFSGDMKIDQILSLRCENERTAFRLLETLEITTAISASDLTRLSALAPSLETLICEAVDVGGVEPNVRLLELDLYGSENKGSLHQYAKTFPSLQYLRCSLAPEEGLFSYIANAPGNPLSSSSDPRQGDLFKNLLQLYCKVEEDRVDCRPEIFALFLHQCFPRYTSIDLGSPYSKRGLYGMWARDVATHRRKLGEKAFPQQPGFIKVEADHFLKNQIIGGVADN